MNFRLKPLAEQVIVITGASSGIGLATALAAGKAGAKLVLASRNGEALAQAEQAIRNAGGEAIHVVADVSRREDLEALAAAAIATYGRFDTWVNNAGLSIFGRLDEVSEADHRQLFDINFWGVVNGSLIAAKYLKDGGAIINLGSVASDVAFPMQGMYSASKHAVKGFTDAFRQELEAEGAPVSVVLIKPASIDTPFPRHAKNYTPGEPILPPPIYRPEDVAAAILHAAVAGGRDYYVGSAARVLSTLNKYLPSVVDWFGSRFIPGQSVKDEAPERERDGALHEAGPDGRVRGGTERMVRASISNKANEYPILTGAAIATLGAGLAAALLRGGRR